MFLLQQASTWEEKNIGKWAHALLKDDLLPSSSGTAAPLTSAEQSRLTGDLRSSSGLCCGVRITGGNAVSGDVTHVYSRGKQRVVFELQAR